VNVKSLRRNLVVRDARRRSRFTRKAFGAVEIPQESGAPTRATDVRGDRHREGRVYLNDDSGMVYSLPLRRRAQRLPCICLWKTLTPAYERAVAAGCKVIYGAFGDQFWGDR